MAHNLFGERFLGYRQPAWHGLGKIVDSRLTATEAVTESGLDYEISKCPLYTQFYGVDLAVENQFILMRDETEDDPQPRSFGIVSDDYEVIQNTELAKILDPLTQEFPVETCGALGYGEKVFMALAVGSADIEGDEIKEYFLLNAGHTGSDSIRLMYTPVRVVCQNTLIMATRASTVSSVVLHNRGAAGDLRLAVDLMARLRGVQAYGLNSLRQMALSPLVTTQINQIIDAAYPLPRKSRTQELVDAINQELPQAEIEALMNQGLDRAVRLADLSKYPVEAARANREAVVTVLDKFNDEFPQFANTGWAVYNAVVELEDFKGGKGAVEESALFGPRAAVKARAYTATMAQVS